MSDTFLPGSGFDTYEQQDKVLVGLCGGTGCKAAVRILQQQGFAVMGAVVRLCTDDPVVDAAKEAAKALGIECITLNASELASQLAEETAAPADLRFPALLAAADRLGIQYIATGHRARVETGADGVHVLCPAEIADESARLAALPQETLGRLILPWAISAPRMQPRWQQNKTKRCTQLPEPVSGRRGASLCSVLFHRTTLNGNHPLTLRRSGSSCGPTENWHRSCSQGTYTWRRGP